MKKALLQLHIAIFLWGTTAVLGKIILLDEMWLVWFRLFLTSASLMVLDIFLHEIEKTTLKQKIHISLTGTLLSLHWVCFFASVKYANVAIGLICLSSTSLFTTLFQSLIYKTKINTVELLLSLLAITSVVLLFYNDFSLQKGIVYGVASALFVATVPILNKQQLQKVNMPTVTFWNITGGLIGISIALPIYIFFIPQPNATPSNMDFVWLVVLSWLCTIVTWRLSLNALKYISAFTQNLLLNLEPVYGIALAAIFLKEYKSYTIFFYIGIILLLTTIFVQTLLLRKNKY
jgi:drug/metabolite transporter (DMT)-like permease